MLITYGTPCRLPFSLFFFFNDTATTEIYTLSLHDALPILLLSDLGADVARIDRIGGRGGAKTDVTSRGRRSVALDLRSEEHTPQLPSPHHLAFPLFL